MVIGVVVVVLVGMAVFRWRRHSTLAGRNSDKPTYMVARPERSVGKRKTEVL